MPLSSDLDSTYVHRKGLTPNTMSVISSKNKLYAVPSKEGETSKKQVGIVATFDPSESRSVEPVRGIGFGDQIAELVPGVTEPMSLSVTRTATYLSSIYQVFGYKGGVDGLVRSLKHHRWPFDIKQELVFSQLISENIDSSLTSNTQTPSDIRDADFQAIVTFYEACWFQDWGTSFAADTALVQENCTLMVSDVHNGTNALIADASEDTGNSSNSIRIQDTNNI
jgi:hypothetical protein